MTIEELWGKYFNGLHWDDISQEKEIEFAKEYARLKCQELLLLVVDKAEVECVDYEDEQEWIYYHKVNKDSILNAVDLDSFIS